MFITNRNNGFNKVNAVLRTAGNTNKQITEIQRTTTILGEYTQTALKELCLNVGLHLEDLYTKYKLGEYEGEDGLINTFTYDKFNELSATLFGLKSNTGEVYYECIRNIINLSLEGFRQSITTYTELLNNKKMLEECQDKADILDDATRLQEYLEQLSRSMYLMEVPDVRMTVVPEVKEEYRIYIERYGFPENAVFDVDKMGEIINELNLQNHS